MSEHAVRIAPQAPPGSAHKLSTDELFKRYARDLLRVAERRLRPELLAKVSAEDVVQSAFKSFVRRFDEFRLDRDQPASLWALLVVITVRKCTKWHDVFHAEKRSLLREIHLDSTPDARQGQELVDRGPGPEGAAVFVELTEVLLSKFLPRQRQMILLRMQGFTLTEIAQRLQSSQRTVARVIAEAKQFLRQILKDA